jgi:hypothetical protein
MYKPAINFMSVILVIQICTDQNQYKNHLHKRLVKPDEAKNVFRQENAANAVMGIATWIYYFYFDKCTTPLS